MSNYHVGLYIGRKHQAKGDSLARASLMAGERGSLRPDVEAALHPEIEMTPATYLDWLSAKPCLPLMPAPVAAPQADEARESVEPVERESVERYRVDDAILSAIAARYGFDRSQITDVIPELADPEDGYTAGTPGNPQVYSRKRGGERVFPSVPQSMPYERHVKPHQPKAHKPLLKAKHAQALHVVSRARNYNRAELQEKDADTLAEIARSCIQASGAGVLLMRALVSADLDSADCHKAIADCERQAMAWQDVASAMKKRFQEKVSGEAKTS